MERRIQFNLSSFLAWMVTLAAYCAILQRSIGTATGSAVSAYLLLSFTGAIMLRVPGRWIGGCISDEERASVGWLGSLFGATLSILVVLYQQRMSPADPIAEFLGVLVLAAIVATLIEILLLPIGVFRHNTARCESHDNSSTDSPVRRE